VVITQSDKTSRSFRRQQAAERIGASTSFASSVIDHAQIGQFWARSSDLAAWFAAASD
jgi:hypothetical protein